MTFKEYWPIYLKNHSNPRTRLHHFWSLMLYFLSWLPGIFFQFWWGVPFTLVLGYAFAWYTHHYVEKNALNVEHPVWGIVANLKMFFLILLRRPLN